MRGANKASAGPGFVSTNLTKSIPMHPPLHQLTFTSFFESVQKRGIVVTVERMAFTAFTAPGGFCGPCVLLIPAGKKSFDFWLFSFFNDQVAHKPMGAILTNDPQ